MRKEIRCKKIPCHIRDPTSMRSFLKLLKMLQYYKVMLTEKPQKIIIAVG